MTRSRPDLIVPIRDRRQRRRILTLRNFRNACFVLVALLAGITIEANLRGGRTGDDFGRLVSPQIQSPASLPKHPEIAPTPVIEDQNAADPTLVQAMNRSVYLRDDRDQAPAVVPAAAAPVPHDTSKVEVVGGPGGVSVVNADPQHPVLHGGFGR